jgi:diguanylate cyclase (GGDEF)-like protein/PAS domain S-box-containing protein
MLFEYVFRRLVENTNDVIMVLDATPPREGGPYIVYVNPAFETLMGYRSDEVIGQNPKILQGKDTDDGTRHTIRQAMTRGERIRTQILNYAKDGQQLWLDISVVPIHDDEGELVYFAAIERDLTEHKHLQSRLEALASTDSLTRLPNRQAIMNKANEDFARARRDKRPLSILMIDIDHFKSINDRHGHAAGDHVLREVSTICRDVLRGSDVMGRIGGEEFVVLLPDAPRNSAEHVAERMRSRLAGTNIYFLNLQFTITASFGVATINDDDETVQTMLDRADEAMYQAKHGGRNQVRTAA